MGGWYLRLNPSLVLFLLIFIDWFAYYDECFKSFPIRIISEINNWAKISHKFKMLKISGKCDIENKTLLMISGLFGEERKRMGSPGLGSEWLWFWWNRGRSLRGKRGKRKRGGKKSQRDICQPCTSTASSAGGQEFSQQPVCLSQDKLQLYRFPPSMVSKKIWSMLGYSELQVDC